tara:strand:- start:823 stop:1026 length:204 start_codon:yes stop_codon:yes gene_type:complete
MVYPRPDVWTYATGLTKRELFAAMAMQGLSANPGYVESLDAARLARWSVSQADALLAALAEEESDAG